MLIKYADGCYLYSDNFTIYPVPSKEGYVIRFERPDFKVNVNTGCFKTRQDAVSFINDRIYKSNSFGLIDLVQESCIDTFKEV